MSFSGCGCVPFQMQAAAARNMLGVRLHLTNSSAAALLINLRSPMQSNPAVLTVVTAAAAGRDSSRQNGSADAVACEMSDRSSCSGFNMDADRCAIRASAAHVVLVHLCM